MAVRRATRGTSSSRESAKDSKGAKPVRSSFRGAAGRQQMEEEQKRAEVRREMSKNKANQPFRFWVPATETRQVVIVDDSPDFFRYEHALKDNRSGRYDVFVPCIDEHANCGACAVDGSKPSYFGMYLTVIDLTPYDNADGDEVEWSKKLLVAKPAQQKKINRLYEKHGTTRGMILDLTRDGKKDAAIGNDIEFVDFMDEEELEEYVTEYKDREGKVHEVIGYEPFDYDELFPDMTEEEINNLAGVSRSSGGRDAEDRDLGRRPRRVGRGKDDDDEPAPRRAASRRAPKEEEEEPAPRRSARRAPKEEEEEEEAPVRSRRAVSRAEPEEEEEEPPVRARRSTASSAPTRASRKVREPLPEEEEEEEQRPARGRRGTTSEVPFDRDEKKAADPAARRAQLRGRR